MKNKQQFVNFCEREGVAGPFLQNGYNATSDIEDSQGSKKPSLQKSAFLNGRENVLSEARWGLSV